jgi:predicted Fe-Mo cluster-binding NifX family protein
MRVAIPYWRGRVSPVFDVAKNFLLVDVKGGQELSRSQYTVDHTDPVPRAREMAELKTDVLVCFAISWPQEMALNAVGIRTVSQICGPIEGVLSAFLRRRLRDKVFAMPDSCGRETVEKQFRKFRGQVIN